MLCTVYTDFFNEKKTMAMFGEDKKALQWYFKGYNIYGIMH